MADIRIVPASSIMSFTSSLNFIEKITQDASGSLNLYGSGSTGRTEIFSVDGNNGRLFTISDDLSDSLFSVNTIAGLPVIEAFADNTVILGTYGSPAITVNGTSASITGSLFGTASWATNVVNNGVTSVGGTGTVNGITLTGTVTSTGNLTLGGTLGGIGNSQLTNSNITVGATAIALGSSATTIVGLSSVTSTTFVGGLTGSLLGTASFANTSNTALSSSNFVITSTLRINGTLTDSATVVTSISGTNNMFTQATGSFKSAFYKYYAINGLNARSGEVMAIWSGTSIQYTDYSTLDIGSTAAVTMSAAIVGSDVQFNAITNSSGWNLKSLVTYI